MISWRVLDGHYTITKKKEKRKKTNTLYENKYIFPAHFFLSLYNTSRHDFIIIIYYIQYLNRRQSK